MNEINEMNAVRCGILMECSELSILLLWSIGEDLAVAALPKTGHGRRCRRCRGVLLSRWDSMSLMRHGRIQLICSPPHFSYVTILFTSRDVRKFLKPPPFGPHLTLYSLHRHESNHPRTILYSSLLSLLRSPSFPRPSQRRVSSVKSVFGSMT